MLLQGALLNNIFVLTSYYINKLLDNYYLCIIN